MAKKSFKRVPNGYNGIAPTGRTIKDLLPKVMSSISKNAKQRHDLIFAAWPDIIGPKCAGMTKAVFFKDGILYVKVSNSTLLSLLMQHERTKLLKKLRKAFPSVTIKSIYFRLG